MNVVKNHALKGYSNLTRSNKNSKLSELKENNMNRGGKRNVYALRGTPFVLVKGFRCYARSEKSNAVAGQKLTCSKPEVTEESVTVMVYTRNGTETCQELFGGALQSEHIELP